MQSGYYNEEITAVNDHVIRVSVMTSGYPWHLHPNSDETFIVIEGILILETQDKVLQLEAGRIATIPANVERIRGDIQIEDGCIIRPKLIIRASAPNIETAKEPKQKPLNATQLTHKPPKRTRLNQLKS